MLYLNFKRYFLLYFFLLLTPISLIFSSCGVSKINKSATIQLRFLDEYVIPDNTTYEGTLVGGLSGIDYDGEFYYVIVDVPSNPRIYKFSIPISEEKIDTVTIEGMTTFQKNTDFIKNNVFDSESILKDPKTGNFIVSGEGNISRSKVPSIIELDTTGTYVAHYELPSYFAANRPNGLINNGVFEGLSRSIDGNGIWVSTELPMRSDGPKPTLFRTKSPVRLTYYDKNSKKAEKQFSYLLAPIKKVPFLPFMVNGASDVLAISDTKFIFIERAFSAGHGMHGNTIRLFEADAAQATNTLEMPNLKGKIKKKVKPMQKKLIFDFKSVKKRLTENEIDNIEGITFGPTLENGNKTLLLIADDNFSSYGKQLNQVILMEIIVR